MDYISIFWMLFFFALTPLLRTRKEIDLITLPAWVLCAYSMFSPFQPAGRQLNHAIALKGEQSLIMVLIALLIMLLKSNSRIFSTANIYKFFGWMGIVNLSIFWISMPFYYFGGPIDSAGIIERAFIWRGITWNVAMSGILTAVLFPYMILIPILERNLFKFTTFCIVSVILYGQTSPIIAMCGSFAWMYLETLKEYKKEFRCDWIAYIVQPMAIIFIVCVVGNYFIPGFLESNGRWEGYRFFFSHHTWWEWIIGKMPGSFFVTSIAEQAKYNYAIDNGFWLYLHSDPLQVLYEYGVIGCGVVTLFLVRLAKRLLDLREGCAIAAMLAGGIFYYPIHYPLHLFVFFLLLKAAYSNTETVNDLLGGI